MCQKQGPVTIGNGPLLLTIIINIEQYTIKLDKSYLLTKSFVYELQAKIKKRKTSVLFAVFLAKS